MEEQQTNKRVCRSSKQTSMYAGAACKQACIEAATACLACLLLHDYSGFQVPDASRCWMLAAPSCSADTNSEWHSSAQAADGVDAIRTELPLSALSATSPAHAPLLTFNPCAHSHTPHTSKRSKRRFPMHRRSRNLAHSKRSCAACGMHVRRSCRSSALRCGTV